jgi:hypothetical protein
MTNLKEILLYRNWTNQPRGYHGRIVLVESDDNGIFDRGQGRTIYEDKPYILLGHQQMALETVKVVDADTKAKILEIEAKIKQLHTEWTDLMEQKWSSLPHLTWDWMQAHESPGRSISQPYVKKSAIIKLRKGSKVLIDGSQPSIKFGAALRVGTLKRRNKDCALLEFGNVKIPKRPFAKILKITPRYPDWMQQGTPKRLESIRYVAYFMLRPYSLVALTEEIQNLKANLPIADMTRKVTQQLNQMLR